MSRFLAVTMLAASLLVTNAHGGGRPGGSDDEPKKDRTLRVKRGDKSEFKKRDRTVDLRNTGKKVMAKSKSMLEDGTQDEFSFQFSIAGYPNLRLKYSVKGNRTDDEKQERLSFRVGLFRLAEVTDSVDAFSSSSFIRLTGRSNQWSDVTVKTTELSTGTVHNCTTTREFANGAKVRWETFVTSTTSTLGEMNLSPGAVKFSFAVDNFPYQLEGSQLALVAKITARSTDYSEDSNNGLAVGAGSFKWNDWVIADGDNVSISQVGRPSSQTVAGDDVSSDDQSEPGEASRFVVFIVNATQPTSVLWDPELSSDDSLSADSYIYQYEASTSIAPVVLLLLLSIIQCIVLQ